MSHPFVVERDEKNMRTLVRFRSPFGYLPMRDETGRICNLQEDALRRPMSDRAGMERLRKIHENFRGME